MRSEFDPRVLHNKKRRGGINSDGDKSLFRTYILALLMVHSAQPKNDKTRIKNHLKGDIGMANYEKQVEQEAAYPIHIFVYTPGTGE